MSRLLAGLHTARWALLFFAVSLTVGCQSCGDSGGEEGDDYARSGIRRGGSVSPSRLNSRPAYWNS